MLKSTPNVRKSPRSGLNLEGRLSDPQILGLDKGRHIRAAMQTLKFTEEKIYYSEITKWYTPSRSLGEQTASSLQAILALRQWKLFDRRDLLGIVVQLLDLHLVNVDSIPTGPTHGEGRLQPHPGDVLTSTPNVRKSPRSGLNLEGRLSDPQICDWNRKPP